jgi:hypothetical protein
MTACHLSVCVAKELFLLRSLRSSGSRTLLYRVHTVFSVLSCGVATLSSETVLQNEIGFYRGEEDGTLLT